MGIGGTLNKNFSSYSTKYKLNEIYHAFRTDENFIRVAVDMSIEKISVYCALWSSLVDKIVNENSDLTAFLNDDYIFDQVCNALVSKNRAFRSANLDPYWCFEGKPNKNKLATQSRVNENNRKKEELLMQIFKAEEACKFHNGHTESLKRIQRFSYVKQKLMENFPSLKLEYFDSKKEDFSKIYARIVTLAQQVRIYPSKFHDRIEKFMMGNDEFKCVKVPEISEAEKLGAILTQIGFCKILFTKDSDAIVLGARYVAIKSSDKEYAIYSYEKILSGEKLTPNSLLTFGILLGNDFNTKEWNTGFAKCRKLLDDSNFCIFKHNADLCGILNPDICVDELGIKKEEREIVFKALDVFRSR